MAYYFDNDESVKSDEKTIMVKINNNLYTFKTDNNVFSKNGLDFGTRTLLNSLDIKILKGDILDVGCGYGPIGIYIKSVSSSCVDMIDVNQRALKLAQKNALLNNVCVNIFTSDVYSNVSKKYDFIITNPPVRVGKKILYNILFKAQDYLKKTGFLYLVINKNQGAKSLYKELQKVYKVELLNKNKGFYVFRCQIR